MDVEHLCWLREYVFTDAKGLDSIRMGFSYDDGRGRTPRFFRVPPHDMAQASALYVGWGGFRPEGYRQGIKGPSLPFAPSTKVWRQLK